MPSWKIYGIMMEARIQKALYESKEKEDPFVERLREKLPRKKE